MRIIEVIVLTLVLLAAEFLTWFTIYNKSVTVAYDGLIGEYTANVERVSVDFETELAINAADTTLDYDWSGELTEEGLNIVGLHSGVPAMSIRNNLTENPVNFYTLSELFDNAVGGGYETDDKNVYTIYGERQGDGSVQLSAQKLTSIVDEQFSLAGFEGIILIRDSGRLVYSTDLIASQFIRDKSSLPKGSAETITVEWGSKQYVLSLRKLSGTNYYLGGYADFEEDAAKIAALKRDMILIAVLLGVITMVLFVVGVYLSGGIGIKSNSTTYQIYIDPDGRILKANKAFREEYPEVPEIREKVAYYEENEVYAIKVGLGSEEDVLTCTINKRSNGTILLQANKLNVPYGSEFESEHRETMETTYNSLIEVKERVLVGVVYLESLHDIKTMFGRGFSENVHNIIYNKLKERMRYVYDIDGYTFGTLYPDGKELPNVIRDLPELVTRLNQVVRVGENLVNIRIKCGFALSDKGMESNDYAYVMMAADAALQRASEETGDGAQDFYLYQEAQKRLYSKYFFKIDIPQMLKNGDFDLEYQPQYSVKQNKIVAFEALFRAKKRVQLKASTFDIISYAERSGYMVMLGDFIFNMGMRFAKSIEGTGVGVSLNVSPIQLMQAGFVDNFLKLVRKYDLQPDAISLEITESFLMTTFDETLKKLQILRANGIGLHLDDFGTAYSTFLYLKRLPITAIKIDRSFIQDISVNKYSELITDMMLNISNKLELSSICEGVETLDQLEVLEKLGCDVIQGYLISKSVDGERARDMIGKFKLDRKKLAATAADESNS